MEARKAEAEKEADELLERITKSKLSYYCMEGATEEEQKELRNMKQKVLVDARELLDNQKKVSERQENFIDILGDTNKLEKEFFEEE